MNSLNGKKIFVTGGSRGIGAGIARHLAQLGAQVAFSYASKPELAENVLKQLPGSGHFSVQMDISNEESVNLGCEKVLSTFGNIDGLVNNAGITKDQIILRMKTDDFDQVIQTNLRGTFLVTKNLLKPMLKARKGSVVSITSVVGQTGNVGQSNYSAAKAGTEAFSKSLALELASRNIRFNCIAPGFIETDMTQALDSQVKEDMLKHIPLERMGSVDDIANAAAFLLSDESGYITGHTLNVNGGMFMS